MLGIFLVELSLGWITISELFVTRNNTSFWLALILTAIVFICVGIYEELWVRGYLLRNLAEGFSFINPRTGVVLAWLLSSLLFGVLHLANPGATWLSTLNISLAGLMIGLPILLSGRLGMAIGLHITWNFAQGNLFGFPVSGHSVDVTLLAIEQSGPEIWTGGVFGPEAGLIGLFALLTGSVLIIFWTGWQSRKLTIYEAFAQYMPARKSH